MVNKFWNRGSIVGIVTVLLTGRSGARIPVGERDFSLLRNVQTGSGTHPASCSVGTEVLLRGQSGLGCAAKYSPPSIAEVRSEWSYTFSPRICVDREDVFTLVSKYKYYDCICSFP